MRTPLSPRLLAAFTVLLSFAPVSFSQSPSSPASREGLNHGLPRWVTLGSDIRFRAEGQHGIGFQEGRNNDFLNQRLRFSLALQPTQWMQFLGEVQDARAFGIQHPDGSLKDAFDLRQAYLFLGREGGWWDLKAGRQKMLYGSERVVGAAEWGNTARVYDAIRLGLHRRNDRVDIFSSSVVQNDADHWDHHQQGNNLHGIYASLGSPIPGSKLEPYALYRTIPRAVDETGAAGRAHSFTYGLRSAGAIQKAWTYEAEAQIQRGTIALSGLRAWATTVQLQRALGQFRWKPSLLGEFNYASGDPHRGDRTINTLDQLYPTNHGIYGVADQIGRRNTKNFRSGLWLRPEKWLTLKAEGHFFWLANSCDALYAFNGAVSVPAVKGCAASTYIGPELDLLADFKVSKYYDIGAQFGHLFPGRFLDLYSAGSGRTFYAVFLGVHL